MYSIMYRHTNIMYM